MSLDEIRFDANALDRWADDGGPPDPREVLD